MATSGDREMVVDTVHLRRDEGSVLSAELTADGAQPPSDDGTRNLTITTALAEGYLFEP